MKVRSVRRISLDVAVPVYDITVPETENFCLAAGPVVHNSKDVADAICGVASFLLTRKVAWTQKPTFVGSGGYMLHGNRTVHDTVFLPETKEEPQSKRRKIKRAKTPDRKTLKRVKRD